MTLPQRGLPVGRYQSATIEGTDATLAVKVAGLSDEAKRAAIARMGGLAVANEKHAYWQSRTLAVSAGSKGGKATGPCKARRGAGSPCPPTGEFYFGDSGEFNIGIYSLTLERHTARRGRHVGRPSRNVSHHAHSEIAHEIRRAGEEKKFAEIIGAMMAALNVFVRIGPRLMASP